MKEHERRWVQDRMGREGEMVQPMLMLLVHGFASHGRCIGSTTSTSSNNIIVSHNKYVECTCTSCTNTRKGQKGDSLQKDPVPQSNYVF